MPRYLLAVAALTAGVVLGAEPSRANDEAPWCAIENNGAGSVREICEFWSIAACQREVISGNRGTCGVNPYWTGAQREGRPTKRKAGGNRRRQR
jgi:hypothetical protein